ncbi:MAG TPA: YceD family protein [Streptosporangiaceae bacterium]
MPHQRKAHRRRLDPGAPLVFDIAALGPGTARTEWRARSAPAGMGVEMVRVPEGGELELDVQLEGVTEGVLVTATVTAPLVGECARCLEPFTSATSVRFQELFALTEDVAGPDGYVLDADGLLDLEPALRDALVLELPLSPLCADDCEGLCSECGVRLADAEPDHGHEQRGPLWEALKNVRAGEPEARPGEDRSAPDQAAGPETSTRRTEPVPERVKEP